MVLSCLRVFRSASLLHEDMCFVGFQDISRIFEHKKQAKACSWRLLAIVLHQSSHPPSFHSVDPLAQICV